MAERLKAGEAIIELLRPKGVSHIFGIVGSSYLTVLDPLYYRTDIQFIGVRHEQGAALMADGFSRISGAPSVCLVTNDPGVLNLTYGIASPYVANSPVVVVAPSASRSHQYRDATQELSTAVEYNLPVISLVMNNVSWVSDKTYQRYAFNERYIWAQTNSPRLDKYAKLFGGTGFYVERPEDIGNEFEEALKAGKSSIIVIPIDPDELPRPARLANVEAPQAS